MTMCELVDQLIIEHGSLKAGAGERYHKLYAEVMQNLRLMEKIATAQDEAIGRRDDEIAAMRKVLEHARKMFLTVPRCYPNEPGKWPEADQLRQELFDVLKGIP